MKFFTRLIVLLLAIILGFWLSASGVLNGTTVGGWMDSIMNVLPVTSDTWEGATSLPSLTSPDEENPSHTTPTTSYPEESDIDYELIYSEIIRLVNELRTGQGLNPLTENTELNQAASIRAEESSQIFSHTRPDGREPFTVFDDGINYNYRMIGENLGMATYHGGETEMAEFIFDGWFNSQGHYENMIHPDYTEIGVGVYYDGENLYATQMFGSPL